MPSAAAKPKFSSLRVSGSRYRLIPSRFPTVDLYKRVSAREHWPIAQQLEDLTNPRVRLKLAQTNGAGGPTEHAPKLQNWNQAPYAYRNPDGTWLLPSSYNVLELSDSVQTALAVSVRKRETFLGSFQSPPTELEMRVLCHAVDGVFLDLRSLDTSMSQTERWVLGEQLLLDGAAGAIFKCPHRTSNDMIAIFDSEPLGKAIQTQHYKFKWDGTAITEIYNFRDDSDGKPILANQVFGNSDLPVFAAR